MIDKPGVYPGLPMAEYLAAPAVNASLVLDVIQRCPRAAWFNSWLNPKRPSQDNTKEQGNGIVAHSIFLEGHAGNVAVIDPQNYVGKKGGVPKGWTNDAIKEARDNALAAGQIPKLVADMVEIEAMVAAAREFIATLHEPEIRRMFEPAGGESETTIVWEEDDGTLCKIRPDRLSADRGLIVDYKTGGTSSEPNTWGRTQMVKMGYYVSAAFYRRGIEKVFGVEPDYVFMPQEQKAPYLPSLVGIEPAGYALGSAKASRGLRTWKECVKSGVFPAYPPRICYVELPPWEMATEDDAPQGIPYDIEKIWGHFKDLENDQDEHVASS